MCFSKTPKVETPPPVQAPQDPQIADLNAMRKKRMAAGGMAGGSLLTGPTGVDNASLNFGKGSLLGS